MCGYICHLSFQGSINLKNFKTGLYDLNHRGPDSNKVIFKKNYFFGHQRLKIIDLTENASQPMLSADGRFIIVFNGEIYNYKALKKELKISNNFFNSDSDTEVILHSYIKWGKNCLKKFEGIFSFVIYDTIEDIIFAARDRMGVKPLYYKHDNKGITISSRPGAILKATDQKLNLNNIALNIYLKAGYIPSPYSIYQGINQLEAGNYFYLKKNKTSIKICRWWSSNRFYPKLKKKFNEKNLIDELENLLIKSVKYRLVSDVPVGVFLSGGLDSSLIASIASKVSNRKISTYSIGFTDKKYDESMYAEKVSRHIQSNHLLKKMSINDLLELMPHFQNKFDEPFSDVACFPTMALGQLVSKNQKVVLSGDGGDELFGGYHYYKIISRINNLYKLPISIRKLISIFFSVFPFHKSKLLNEALNKENIVECFSFMRSVSKDFLFNNTLNEFDKMFFNAFLEMPSSISIEEIGSRLDLHLTLGNGYLQKLDLSTMAFSVEAREPFLDSTILKFALELPWCLKVNKGVTKYLLKKVANKYLPQDIIYREKKGFEVPIASWLNNELEGWVKEKIYNKELFEGLPFFQKDIINLHKSHTQGSRNVTPCLWNILVLLNFIEKNK